MKELLNKIKNEIEKFEGSTEQSIEQFRVHYVGKKSKINQLFEDFKKLSVEDKKNTESQ